MNYIHLLIPPHPPIQATIIFYSFIEDEEEKEVQQKSGKQKSTFPLISLSIFALLLNTSVQSQ